MLKCCLCTKCSDETVDMTLPVSVSSHVLFVVPHSTNQVTSLFVTLGNSDSENMKDKQDSLTPLLQGRTHYSGVRVPSTPENKKSSFCSSTSLSLLPVLDWITLHLDEVGFLKSE